MSLTDERGAGPEAPWVTAPEASRTFREVHLRLLMKEREDASRRLADLDSSIWGVEEALREGP